VLIASSQEVDLPLVKLADFGVSLLTGEGSGPVSLLSGRKPSASSLRGSMTPPAVPSAQSQSPTAEIIGDPPTRDMYTASEEDDEADTDSVMKLDDADLGTASLMVAELKTTPRASSARPLRPSASSGPPPIPRLGPGPASNPGVGPASNPGVRPASNPGVGPASNPGVGPASNPGVGPASNPGVGPASNPGVGSPSKPVVSVNPLARTSPSRPSSRPPPPIGPATLEMEAVMLPEGAATATASSLDAAEGRTPPPPSQVSLSAMLAAAPEDSVVVSGMLTQADALIGTPMYMAPELCNTGSHRAEPLSDIFSIGVIAFELLTGRMPFAVPPVISRANDEPIFITRLSRIRPDLDPRLIALVESCLALNPDSRLRAAELTRRLIELGAPSPQG
jgi:serine/threonine protein kinase